MYVGTGLRNNDVFVMTARGIVKSNTITRRPPEDQFKYDNCSELRGVPWRLQAREPGEVRVDLSQALNSLGAGPVPDAAPVIDEEQEVFDHLPLT